MLAKSNWITMSLSFNEDKKKICSVKVPRKRKSLWTFWHERAFSHLLYLVCSVNRPFNDGECNSRPIIIPNHPPFLKQLCSKVTAAITAGSSGSATPFKQVSFVANGRTLLHRYDQNEQIYSMSSWFTVSSVQKKKMSRKTKTLAPLHYSSSFHV